MLKIFVFLFLCLLIVGGNGFTMDEIIDEEIDDEVGQALIETKNLTANLPFLVTFFLGDEDGSEEITSFGFGTIIGKNEILTSMKFHFEGFVHLYLVYNGTTVIKLDENVDILFSEKYNETNGWFDAFVIKVPNVDFGPDRIIELSGSPDAADIQESFTIQFQAGHMISGPFENYDSEQICTQLGDSFSVDQQACGKGFSPFINAKVETWNIFGAPWFIVENEKPYLIGFNSFYNAKTPAVNIMTKTDFICQQKFVNYEFSCKTFNDSVVENLTPFSEESLDSVLNENPSVVAIFMESNGLFNRELKFIGFGVAHSSNGFLTSSAVAEALNTGDEDDKTLISTKNHKNILLENPMLNVNENKDVSSWHDIAIFTSDSIDFEKADLATLNKDLNFHAKDLQIIEQTSENEIAWAKYDLYSDKVCARAFSDIHCCEYGPDQQICGPDHDNRRFPSTPLFDDQGKFVGIFATKNQFDHGQNVDVFTRIDANIEWINSYF